MVSFLKEVDIVWNPLFVTLACGVAFVGAHFGQFLGAGIGLIVVSFLGLILQNKSKDRL